MTKHRCTGLLLALLIFLVFNRAFAQNAKNAAPSIPDDRFSARVADLDRGNELLAAYKFPDAIEAFNRVMSGVAVADSLSAVAQHKIGVAYYGNYEDSLAMVAYGKAVRMRDEVFSGPVIERAHSRLNLGQIFMDFGRTDTAALLLREAIEIYEGAQPTDTLNWVRALTSLTSFAEDKRDYQVGVNAARRATDLLTKMPAVSPEDAINVWYTIGKAYQVFGVLPAARRAADQAWDIAAELDDVYAQVMVLNLLGAISQSEHLAEQSLGYHLRAVELSKRAEIPDNELGVSHLNIALQYKELNRLDLALKHQALALPLLMGEPVSLPKLYSLQGDIYLRKGDFSSALTALNTGAHILDDGEEDYPDPAEYGPAKLEVLADLLGDRAEVHARLKLPEAARKDYELLFRVQDLMRSRVSSDESRRYLSKNLRKFFDRAIDLEYRFFQQSGAENHAWNAFALSERAKAYSLLRSVLRRNTKMPTRETALRSRIASLERAAVPGSSEEARLAAARLELDRLLSAYANDADQAVPDFDRKSLQQLLSEENTQLVGFHLSDSTAYQFVIGPDGTIRWRELEEGGGLPTRVTAWRAALLASAYKRKSLRPAAKQEVLDEAFLQQGLQLYHQLFRVAPDTSVNLCLLPDGVLNVLPFSALPVRNAPVPLDYTRVAYLTGKSGIHCAYSARVWQELVGKASGEYQDDLLAFAPDFEGDAEVVGFSRSARVRAQGRALEGLAPLAFNRPEVEEITDIVGRSRAFTGAAASRKNFLDHLGNARILHLSTHGVVNLAEPEFSFVAFSQLGDSLEYEEMLYHNDLSSLSINAELAVLSACETSLGAYVPGETTLSLASAFTAAGARSTLTSLWQVDDAATKDLIVRFYQELIAGKSRSEALALAQRQHQKSQDYAHPFYWSAMLLNGDARSLRLEAAVVLPDWAPYAIGGVMGFVLLLLGLKRRA